MERMQGRGGEEVGIVNYVGNGVCQKCVASRKCDAAGLLRT